MGNNSRRRFLQYSGAALATGVMVASGCNDDDDMMMADEVNLGSGDLGLLNYAFALEQLEAAFYARVLDGSYFSSANSTEQQILSDLEKHERAHAEFFKAAIDSVGTAIPTLEFDFSAVDFDSRSSVLSTAKTFEDLGVSAYNGAGPLLETPAYLLLAGKIVSVEARHAAAIRSVFDTSNTSFAGDDIIDANGLGLAASPSQVLEAAAPFIVMRINGRNLPG